MFRKIFIASILLPFLFLTTSQATNRPELVLQTGHAGSIRAIAISPDGKWLVSGSQDTTVKIWNLSDGNLLRTLYGHSGKINMVAISPDNRWIASCADDGTARIWDVYGGAEIREMKGHAGPIDSVAFNQSGQVVTASTDIVKIWDLTNGNEVRSIRTSEKDRGGRITLSSDGRIFVIGGAAGKPGGGFMGYGGGDVFRPLKIMDIASGKELISVKTDIQNPYATYALSPDSRLLAIRKGKFRESRNEESIQVLDVASDREVASLKIPGNASGQGTGALTFSPGGKWIAAQSEMATDMKSKLVVFDVASGQIIRNLTTSAMFIPGVNLDSVSSVINPLAFSPDNKILAFGGTSAIQLWDANSGQELYTLRTRLKTGATSGASMNDPQLESAKQQMQQSGMTEEDMSLMNADVSGVMESMMGEESPLSEVFRYADAVSGKMGHMVSRTFADKRLQFTPDGRWLLYEKEKRVGIWDISAGNFIQEAYRMTTPIAFSPDQRMMASMEFDPSKIQGSTIPNPELVVRGLPSMKVISRSQIDSQSAEELSFAADGSWLALISRGPKGSDVHVLDVNTGKEIRSIPLGDSSGTTTSAFSANGKYVAFGGNPIVSGSAVPDVFTMGTQMQMPQKMDKKELEKMQKDLQKQMQAISSMMQGVTPAQAGPYQIKVIDLQTGQPIQSLGVEAEPASAQPEGEIVTFGTSQFAGEEHRIAFSKDGSLIAVEDKDQQIPVVKIYDTAGGGLRSVIRVASKPAPKVDPLNPNSMFRTKLIRPNFGFSADGSMVAITYQEGEYAVKLYEASTGKLVRTLNHNNRVDALSFSNDGRILATMVRDGSQCIWEVSSGKLLATLMEFPGINFRSEWLVATPDGLFDGSPAAWNQILWRFSQNTFDLAPVETFFNDLYYPGLLSEIFGANPPQAPRDISELDRRLPQVRLTTNSDANPRNAEVQIQITEAPADASHPAGSGARDVRLFRNGTLAKVWHGDVLNGQNTVSLQATVPIVAGENRLVAYAFNHENVKSQDSFVKVQGAESLRRSGIAYVLAIGVNQYANPDFNLKYAVADAQSFTENLSQAQTKLNSYSRVEVISLFDQDATKPNILAALQKLQDTQPEDAVFMYYAGHGTAEKSRFYIIPHDLGYAGSRNALDDSGMKTILANSISDEDLEQYFEKIGAGHSLFVIDACNSGQALETEERRRGPMNAKGLAQLAYEKGMYVLAAAQGYQAALEATKLGHGYLTYALVEEGIKTKSADQLPADGEVRVREWLDYAAGRVPEMQLEKMSEGRLLKHEVAFVDGEETIEDLTRRSVQQPRVFYRRDSELLPLIILKPE